MHCDMYVFTCLHVCVEGGGGGAGWMEVDSIANNICIKQNLSFLLVVFLLPKYLNFSNFLIFTCS